MTERISAMDLPVGNGRTLVTGWFSFLDGEATAGDMLALEHLRVRLERAGAPYDVAFSPGFVPDGLSLEDADPYAYEDLIFVCGPLHGAQVAWLHERFPHCTRSAIGTSIVDPQDPAVRGFHRVLPRDGPGVRSEALDLAATAPATEPVPVVGVVLTAGQGEYGQRRRHEAVTEELTAWLGGKDCARVELDTRLDAHDWRHCGTAGQFLSAVARLDLVVTDRLHGLLLALRSGVPALAVDPVSGGAKVSAQARACGWPALVSADAVGDGEREQPAGKAPASASAASAPASAEFERWWAWCLGPGRELAQRRSREFAALRLDDRAPRETESAPPHPA